MREKMTRSFSFKILLYLIVFSVTMLLFLVGSQNILIKYSYEKYQEKKIKNIARAIQSYNEEDILSKLETTVYDNSICAQYIVGNNAVYYNTLMIGCDLNKNNGQINSLINEMIVNNNNIQFMKLVNKATGTKAILSGIKMNSGYVFIYSPLEEIQGAKIVLKTQFIYVTIIVIILACFISYLLSIKITNPITKITKKAKELGEGNYNITFDSSDVLEIDELANTLNHVSQDLSRIDELRRDLMANVSHDLKTPLTMIMAYAEMVRDISYKDKEKMDKDLNVIIAEAERLNILVNDILDLSKMQADAASLHIEKFDLCGVIQEVMSKYDILKINEDYDFIVKLPAKAMVKADKQKILQVIYNLVNNAINYTGEDKKVFVSVIDKKSEYVVEIKDTGKGIKKEEIPYIWDKYYKKEKKHQRNVVSTGIGLSIVREILSKHKFAYGVKSTMHKGTTFYFKIRK
ncbi:MAG: HAMP domain-containing histidine kinase [Bacilli bacterium]|nr:HAMP domain-containing histidine kinase [Bacilli bacterium]